MHDWRGASHAFVVPHPPLLSGWRLQRDRPWTVQIWTPVDCPCVGGGTARHPDAVGVAGDVLRLPHLCHSVTLMAAPSPPSRGPVVEDCTDSARWRDFPQRVPWASTTTTTVTPPFVPLPSPSPAGLCGPDRPVPPRRCAVESRWAKRPPYAEPGPAGLACAPPGPAGPLEGPLGPSLGMSGARPRRAHLAVADLLGPLWASQEEVWAPAPPRPVQDD